MHRRLDQEVYPHSHLCIPGRGAHLGTGAVGIGVRLARCSPSPCGSAQPAQHKPCNEYGFVTLMDLKVNLELLHASADRSCFQKVYQEKNAAGYLNPLDC